MQSWGEYGETWRPFGTLSCALVQISSAPGSGKSTLANLLPPSLNEIAITHDVIKSSFLENGISFKQLLVELTYAPQWVLAKEKIEKGQASVIIDSVCNYQETPDSGAAPARLYDYEYIYMQCKIENMDLLENRLQNRVSKISQPISLIDSLIDATEIQHD